MKRRYGRIKSDLKNAYLHEFTKQCVGCGIFRIIFLQPIPQSELEAVGCSGACSDVIAYKEATIIHWEIVAQTDGLEDGTDLVVALLGFALEITTDGKMDSDVLVEGFVVGYDAEPVWFLIGGGVAVEVFPILHVIAQRSIDILDS